MRGSKRPTTERARAVGIAAVTSIAEASRQTGIPQQTIQQWYNLPEFGELRSRKTEVMEDEWRVGVQMAFRRSIELLAQTEDPVKAATTGAIIYDKLALSSGQATARTESKDITVDIPDDLKRDLRERFSDHYRSQDEGVESERPEGAATTQG
jgi:hypothetical protein